MSLSVVELVKYNTQLTTRQALFKWAVRQGRIELVKCLLADERVDPTAEVNGALREAAWYGHVAVVKCLLADERVDPAAGDNWALREAAKNGHVAVVKCLLADERVLTMRRSVMLPVAGMWL